MGYLAAIRALLELAGMIARYAGDRQLISAGEARAVAEGNAQVLQRLEEAKRVRDAIIADPDGPDAQRVRDRYTRR